MGLIRTPNSAYVVGQIVLIGARINNSPFGCCITDLAKTYVGGCQKSDGSE